MPMGKIIELRKKNLLQREWWILALMALIFLFTIAVMVFILKELSLEAEDLKIFLWIFSFSILSFAAYPISYLYGANYRKKIADKVIDEMLSKTNKKEL